MFWVMVGKAKQLKKVDFTRNQRCSLTTETPPPFTQQRDRIPTDFVQPSASVMPQSLQPH